MKIAHAHQAYDALARAQAAVSTSPIHFYRPNSGIQELFHQSPCQARIILGGNSAGKSYAAMGGEVAYHCVEELDTEGNGTGWAVHPHARVRIPNIGWISSATEEVQKEPEGGTQSYVNNFLGQDIVGGREDAGVWKEKELRNGCRIVFKTMMSGAQAYRSAGIDWLAVDEPHPRSVINEARVRLIRSQPMGRMWWAVTPVADPSKQTTIDMVRWMVRDLVNPAVMRQRRGLPPEDVEVWHMHMRENARHIDLKGAMRVMAGMPDEEQHTRITGEYVLLDIGTGFSARSLETLSHRCEEPLREGHLVYDDGAQFAEGYTYSPDFSEGFIFRFWSMPAEGREYVIGCDPGGISDPCSATVIDIGRREVVAEMHGWLDEVDLALHLQVLGLYYNIAEIGIEVNKEGKTTASYMLNGNRDLGIIPYPDLYYRPQPADLAKGYDTPSRQIGWLTTGGMGGGGTRDLLIGGIRMYLARAMNSDHIYVPSLYHINELQHFNPNVKGRLEAEEGHFDDRVISLGIAIQMLKRRDADWLEEGADSSAGRKEFMEFDGDNLRINPEALERDGVFQESPYYLA